MGFALCLEYIDGESVKKYYIHKSFGLNPDSPKVSVNQNYAMIFISEKKAESFRKQNNIPIDYEIRFVAMHAEKEKLFQKKEKGEYGYKKLNPGNINDNMPNFLR